jgi:protoporphyrinogen oxidase
MAYSKEKRVVIAGAGCAGLAAGVALQSNGFQVTILESSDRVGGLAGGIVFNGNVYEFGPHLFHTTDPEILANVKSIAGKNLIPFQKTIKIKFLGNYFSFPLSIPDVLTKLPPITVVSAVFSFFKYSLIGFLQGEPALVNSEKVLQRYYGDVLYRIFFKDYIYRVWGIWPKGMAPSFATERIPRFDLLDFAKKLKTKLFGTKEKAICTEKYVEKVDGENFTTTKGFSLITDSFAEEFKRLGGHLELNQIVTGIHLNGDRCDEISFQGAKGNTPLSRLKCTQFISTIPLNLIPGMISPALPNTISEAADKLHFRAICFVGILVQRSKVLPSAFMYFRDKSFNRVTDLAQFKVKIEPPGSTILVAEITCNPSDPIWTDENGTARTVIRELCEEGLISEAEVLEFHVFKTTYGYPIYEVGYDQSLKTVEEALQAIPNFHTIGRQGKFAYVNTHVAMKMGYEAAKKIMDQESLSNSK